MSFDAAKISLLGKLAAGVDFSPKGSIDAPIIQLVDFINDLPDFVTTSSCSGRISVFRDENSTKGIHWILVVHGAITTEQLKDAIKGQESTAAGKHFIVLKCEGFILHVRCRDLDSGRKLHQVAMSCGFRESGLSVGQKMRVQLAIRTTAYGLELPIAVGKKLILDDTAINIIVAEANRRLRCNFARTDRLLTAIKNEYLWPSMVCAPSSQLPIHRWGHCFTSDNNGSRLIIGGYGVEVNGSTDKALVTESKHSTRKLSNLLYSNASENPQQFNLNRANNVGNDNSMHADSATLQIGGMTLLIVSGGRESPQQALICLRVYNYDTSIWKPNCDIGEINFAQNGDIPMPRWGHTLTALGVGSSSFLLYGGRDERQVFGDAFLLTAHVTQPSDSTSSGLGLDFTWKKVDCLVSEHGASSALAARFFHAACLVSVTDEITVTNTGSSCTSDTHSLTRVLIHGGLLSLDDPVTCGRAFVLNVCTGECIPLLNISSAPILKSTVDVDGADDSEMPLTGEIEGAVSVLSHLDAVCTAGSTAAHSRRSEVFFRRFGHTITDVGAKTLIIAGGVSFEGSEVGSDGDEAAGNFKGVCAIDLQMSDDSLLCGSLRSLCLSDQEQQWTTGPEGAGVMGSMTEPCVLPCRDCRTHHRAEYNAGEKTLRLMGGGALCMSFGAHYCTSVALRLLSGAPSLGPESSSNESSSAYAALSSSVSTAYPAAVNLGSDRHKDAAIVLLVPSSRVKAVKSFLENQSTCWLDKKRRITVSGVNEEDVIILPMDGVAIAREAFINYDEAARQVKLKEKQSTSMKKEALILLVPPTECQAKKSAADRATSSLMAVPIESFFADMLISPSGLSQAAKEGLCLCLGEDYFFDDMDSQDTVCVLNIKLGKQNVRVSKSLLASGYRKADEYLEGVVREYRLPAAAASAFPRKYEIVGNVLMIPEDSLGGPVWEGVLPPPPSASCPSKTPADSAADKRAIRILTGLGACFGVRKVARKARVDSGPKRESRVRLLLPALGQPSDTGPGSPGWVEVVENGISFGFDVTRVMFCSGNCTERIRMGREAVKGEVIVDLYCGVGYYTIPFLLHGKASRVHALEWNPNSLLAIRENLKKAGDDVNSRCTVYAGDNKESSLLLPNVADRVCLGLLPSSVGGWPLAVSVLKTSGGVLHVHENVQDIEVESWTACTCEQFVQMFKAANKPMTVTCRHVEKVKSYAPHVLHIVADLVCSPAQ